ncbi:transmembrane protein 183A isoform X7 [Cinclus cinclus]|uniref:transmembrane protein 183A isoform X7 n=1 Tax=Cinclus cinclus TaxID=127875 RepID=UPI002E126CE0
MAPRGRPAAAAAMPRRGARKRLKFRADDVCSERVTVADYANSDPAVVKSGRVKKAVANAVQQEVKSLCGLEASCVPTEEVLSMSGESCDSSDEMDTKESINGRAASRKKKSKRHKDVMSCANTPSLPLEDAEGGGGEEYPIDIWLLLASYIRPEDIVRFSLICKKAWTVTCTAAFWTRLYRRHYSLDAYLPLRLRPESMEKLHCLRACVIRSLFHMYEPFAARLSRNPTIPDSTPSTLKNSRASGELGSDTDARTCHPAFLQVIHGLPSLCGTLELLWCQQRCLPFKDTPLFWAERQPHGACEGQDG